jgi:hypothetical protein
VTSAGTATPHLGARAAGATNMISARVASGAPPYGRVCGGRSSRPTSFPASSFSDLGSSADQVEEPVRVVRTVRAVGGTSALTRGRTHEETTGTTPVITNTVTWTSSFLSMSRPSLVTQSPSPDRRSSKGNRVSLRSTASTFTIKIATSFRYGLLYPLLLSGTRRTT